MVVEHGIRCPFCKEISETRVLDSRPCKFGIKRRRLCTWCNKRFNTFEGTAINPVFHKEEKKEGYIK